MKHGIAVDSIRPRKQHVKVNTELLYDMARGPKGSRASNDALYADLANPIAREQLIVTSMSLVVSKVDSYLRQHSDFCYLRDDLISEGFAAITHGVNKLAAGPKLDNPNCTGFLSVCIQHAVANYTQKIARTPTADTKFEGVAENRIAMVELEGELAHCALDHIDQQILQQRSEGFNDRQIGERLGIPTTSINCRRMEMRERFEAANVV